MQFCLGMFKNVPYFFRSALLRFRDIVYAEKPLGFPSGVFINKAKTSDKNTGPRFSITLKTTCKNSRPFAKKIFFTQIVT